MIRIQITAIPHRYAHSTAEDYQLESADKPGLEPTEKIIKYWIRPQSA